MWHQFEMICFGSSSKLSNNWTKKQKKKQLPHFLFFFFFKRMTYMWMKHCRAPSFRFPHPQLLSSLVISLSGSGVCADQRSGKRLGSSLYLSGMTKIDSSNSSYRNSWNVTVAVIVGKTGMSARERVTRKKHFWVPAAFPSSSYTHRSTVTGPHARTELDWKPRRKLHLHELSQLVEVLERRYDLQHVE